MKKILIIEDDRNILDIVAYNLEKEGYAVSVAADGEEGLLAFAGGAFDLVILDVMIPRLSGLEVLDSIRTRSDVPVLIMSAKTSEDDRLAGLARMADDYICKPFSVKELMLRVKVHLNRYDKSAKGTLLQWGAYTIDEKTGTVCRGEEEIPLSKKEWGLLLLFAKNQGRSYSREELLQAFWGYRPAGPDDRTVDVAIRRLRAKIEADPSRPRYILSKRGYGYLAGSGE